MVESKHRPRWLRLPIILLLSLALCSFANSQQVALKGQNDRVLGTEDILLKSGQEKKKSTSSLDGTSLRTNSSGGKKKQKTRSNAQIVLKKSRGSDRANMKQKYQRGGSKRKNSNKNKRRGSGGKKQKKMNKRGGWNQNMKKNKKGKFWGSSTQGKARKAGKSGKGQKLWSGSGGKKNKNKWHGSSGKSGKESDTDHSFWAGIIETYHPTEYPTLNPVSPLGYIYFIHCITLFVAQLLLRLLDPLSYPHTISGPHIYSSKMFQELSIQSTIVAMIISYCCCFLIIDTESNILSDLGSCKSQ